MSATEHERAAAGAKWLADHMHILRDVSITALTIYPDSVHLQVDTHADARTVAARLGVPTTESIIQDARLVHLWLTADEPIGDFPDPLDRLTVRVAAIAGPGEPGGAQ